MALCAHLPRRIQDAKRAADVVEGVKLEQSLTAARLDPSWLGIILILGAQGQSDSAYKEQSAHSRAMHEVIPFWLRLSTRVQS